MLKAERRGIKNAKVKIKKNRLKDKPFLLLHFPFYFIPNKYPAGHPATPPSPVFSYG
jgi:hypothetical protein